jgi:hypothetical protein
MTAETPDDILTPEEFAPLVKIAAKTPVGLCRKGRIPGARKVGRFWRIPRWTKEVMFPKPSEVSTVLVDEYKEHRKKPRHVTKTVKGEQVIVKIAGALPRTVCGPADRVVVETPSAAKQNPSCFAYG